MKKIVIASTLLIATLAQAKVESVTVTTTEVAMTAADMSAAKASFASLQQTTTGGASAGTPSDIAVPNGGLYEVPGDSGGYGYTGGTGDTTGGSTGGETDTGGYSSGYSSGYSGGGGYSSGYSGGYSGGYPYDYGYNNDKVGKVISYAGQVVALGEAVYNLVKKGKPSNNTNYAPVAIVPRDPITKQNVDVFDLENCSMPITRKFKASIKSAMREVVKFEYMLIYTVNCTYNGTGRYIQAAMVQPLSVKTSFGWDFNATMKLNGVMNHGSKASPVVGALLTMKYQMNSWTTAFERNDTIHITGRGGIKTY